MIPVEFTYEGKQYKGELVPAAGAGGNMYHLMVRNYYCGQLLLVEDIKEWNLPRDPATAKYKWRFSSQNGKLDHLEPVFAEAVNKAQNNLF